MRAEKVRAHESALRAEKARAILSEIEADMRHNGLGGEPLNRWTLRIQYVCGQASVIITLRPNLGDAPWTVHYWVLVHNPAHFMLAFTFEGEVPAGSKLSTRAVAHALLSPIPCAPTPHEATALMLNALAKVRPDFMEERSDER
jgi:hypothetical protein